MICCRLHPDCSNTHWGWQDMSTKLKSLSIARVEAKEIQALPFFVYNECALLPQHNVPAGSCPPSLTPPSLHLSQGQREHSSYIAQTCGGLSFCPLLKDSAHKVLEKHIAAQNPMRWT